MSNLQKSFELFKFRGKKTVNSVGCGKVIVYLDSDHHNPPATYCFPQSTYSS